MVENKGVRVVKEDAVLGNGRNESETYFGCGYNDFVFPYTVSFYSEGRYEVVIEGKKAIARKIE